MINVTFEIKRETNERRKVLWNRQSLLPVFASDMKDFVNAVGISRKPLNISQPRIITMMLSKYSILPPPIFDSPVPSLLIQGQFFWFLILCIAHRSRVRKVTATLHKKSSTLSCHCMTTSVQWYSGETIWYFISDQDLLDLYHQTFLKDSSSSSLATPS